MQRYEQRPPSSFVFHNPFHLSVRSPENKPPQQSPKFLKIRSLETHQAKIEPILPPLLVLAAVKTFDDWLEGELGKEVQKRILTNRHSVDMDSIAAYFDTAEDVQQKALIWLWQYWQSDPDFARLTKGADNVSHKAGVITKIAVRGGRCKYAKRRREGREAQTDLCFDDGEEWLPFVLMLPDAIRSTDLPQHDRRLVQGDRHIDIQAAIELVVLRMLAEQSKRAKGNGKIIPMEHITRTIIEGYMHHYTDRYNQTGTFRKFCEARGVSRHQIARWRPLIFQYLREELSPYAPEQHRVQLLPNAMATAAD